MPALRASHNAVLNTGIGTSQSLAGGSSAASVRATMSR